MCQFNCNPWQTPNINPIPFAKILFFEKKKIHDNKTTIGIYMVTVGLHPRRIASMKLKTFL